MKLIVEMWDGIPYAYREAEDHFQRVEPERRARGRRLSRKALGLECDMTKTSSGNWHIVFNLKTKKKPPAPKVHRQNTPLSMEED